MSTWVIIAVVVVLAAVLLAFSVKILKQYERAVQFRLGRLKGGPRGPGLILIIPLVDRIKRVSLRIVTMPIQSQGIITRDTVSIDIAAVAYYRINDPVRSVVAIEDVSAAIDQIAQTTLRSVVGQHTLDETLTETDKISKHIREILDIQTQDWGVEVTLVELKDIQLPDSMKRAMAKQAEAEREKRAKIIAAEGEALAAGQLANASDIMMAHPVALQLRNLQTLIEISVDKNSTIVFPAPLMSTIQELGPSGCGKSTLIRAVVGVQGVAGGDVTVLGLSAGSPGLRRRVGYVTQAPSVYGDLTVAREPRLLPVVAGAPAATSTACWRPWTCAAGRPTGDPLSGGQHTRLAGSGAARPSPSCWCSTSRPSASTRCCGATCGSCSARWPRRDRPWSCRATSWTRRRGATAAAPPRRRAAAPTTPDGPARAHRDAGRRGSVPRLVGRRGDEPRSPSRATRPGCCASCATTPAPSACCSSRRACSLTLAALRRSAGDAACSTRWRRR